ncbi:MAG: MerR family transcriptional regulator [bacterium]
MRIKQAAEQLGLHKNTLIQYERIGLHVPEREDGNNYRKYDDADLDWIGCLREMIQEIGYERKTLARMLELNECWAIRECSDEQKQNCRWFQKLNSSGDR